MMPCVLLQSSSYSLQDIFQSPWPPFLAVCLWLFCIPGTRLLLCCFPLLCPYQLNLWHSDLSQGLPQLPCPLSGSTVPLSAVAVSFCLWDLDSAEEMKRCYLGQCSYRLPFSSYVGCGKCTDIALGTLQVAPASFLVFWLQQESVGFYYINPDPLFEDFKLRRDTKFTGTHPFHRRNESTTYLSIGTYCLG